MTDKNIETFSKLRKDNVLPTKGTAIFQNGQLLVIGATKEEAFEGYTIVTGFQELQENIFYTDLTPKNQ